MALAEVDPAALLALNNLHAAELSWLDPARLTQLLGWASYARGVGDAQAMLIAFDAGDSYDGLHFAWFKARFERFIYVDRVAVEAASRGRGLARLLYADLFGFARHAGQKLVTCEVNKMPPNLASDRFHDRLGFHVVGEASLNAGQKSVRYMTCPVS